MAEVANKKSSLAAALPLGALVSCTTTHGDVVRGNVVATDEATKALVIKETLNSSTPHSSSLNTGDVHIVNLNHVSDINVLAQPQQNGITTDPSALPTINLAKVQQRLEKNVKERMKEVRSKGVNVSEEAQSLFDWLSTIYSEIRWDKDVIIVMNDVRVSPPYTPASCTGSSQLTNMIMKQITKFSESQKQT